MTTFTITPGASDPLVFAPFQPDGTLPDLTGNNRKYDAIFVEVGTQGVHQLCPLAN